MLAAEGFQIEMLPDNRPPFEKLNRMSLYYLLWSNGIENVSDSMPKDKLVKIAELNSDLLLVAGPNGTYGYKNVVAYKDQFGSIVIQRPKEHIEMYNNISDQVELTKAIKTKPSRKKAE